MITLDPSGSLLVKFITTAESELGEFEPIVNRILRHTDGTAWYVPSEGARLWIPDGGVWECLGGWDNVAGNDVPGYAIFTLKYEGSAIC